MSLYDQLELNLFSPKSKYLNQKITSDQAYVVDKETGNWIAISKHYPAELSLQGDFYAHLALKGNGWVVSEGMSGSMLSTGTTQELAVMAAKERVSSFIAKHSESAMYDLLLTAKSKLTKENPRYIQTLAKLEEPEVIEVEPDVSETYTSPIEEVTLKTVVRDCLNYKNIIDIDYISEHLRLDSEEVENQLIEQELAYYNPETNGLEAPDEYLSGNVRLKLKIAQEAAINNPMFDKNVAKLKEIQPEQIPSAFIQYSLGAAWIPKEVFEKFATDMFKTKVTIKYLDLTGKYAATAYFSGGPQIKHSYAAGGKNGLEILNATLNNQQITITETKNGKSTKNLDKTAAAQGMQEQMQDEFQAFIRANRDIEESTEKEYNEIFNSRVTRNFVAPDLTHYPGASTHIFLLAHQKSGVARGVDNSTLFADCVGSGKTYTIITTAMELRRLGKAVKPMIVVQNKTRGQFVASFRDLYPDANILAPEGLELTTTYRGDLYYKIRDQDWDAIILPASQFDMIPDDIKRQKKIITDQINEIEAVLNTINKTVMPMEYASVKRQLRGLNKDLSDLDISEDQRRYARERASEIDGSTPLLNFEDLGVDALLIDEFHRYKRLGGIYTSLSNGVKGIDTAKSKRSQSTLLKMRWVQEHNEGRNTLVYTGTPISNTMAEAWTMIRYVRPDILKKIGIQHFDQFAKTFGQVIPSLEQTGGGTFKIQNRFAKFQNLPEFITAFRECTRVILKEDIKEFQNNDMIPKLHGGQIKQEIVKQSEELRLQIKEFRELLEWYDELEGMDRRTYSYIPLVVFGRAKQASIDLRLLSPANKDVPNSKVNQVIRHSLRIYHETGLVQMIFSDLYQSPEPKEPFLDEDCQIPNPAYGMPRFNLFNDIKQKLIAQGVKPSEIAILTEPKYDKTEKAEQLFADANAARIKFLLGSTERMGVGVNAQKRLIGLHHIDAPNRPMDFEQRNGRIERQGNLNKEIHIFAYGVEKTLDSAAFQRLATKQRFINQIMKGEGVDRVMEDAADEAQMTFDEMMAHLSDSPHAMTKLMLDNRLKSERLKRDNHFAKQVQTQRQLNYALEDIGKLEIEMAEQNKYASVVKEFFADGMVFMDAGGIKTTEQFGTAADTFVDSLMERYLSSPTGLAMDSMLINDVKVNVKIHTAERWSNKAKRSIAYPVLSYTCPEIGIFENIHGSGRQLGTNQGMSMINDIQWQLDLIKDAPDQLKDKIRRIRVTTEELERTMDKVFDETKLNTLEAEIEGLKEKMLAEKNKVVEQDVLEM